MGFSCFRSNGGSSVQNDIDEPPRLKRATTSMQFPKKNGRTVRRHDSAGSRSSTISNESISKLAPCAGVCDPKIDSMMMPIPHEHRGSRSLRLSCPRAYSDIVDSMKQAKGCRDWRNFAVFHDNEIDETISVEADALRRAAATERRLRKFNSISSAGSLEVDMIC